MRRTVHGLGQSLWLSNITRDLLNSGTLSRCINEFSVTGLTSNPTIFDHAIKNSGDYDAAIRQKLKEGKSGEELFFELALEDLTKAADLFRPMDDRACGVDGWVSLEVSPLLAHDTQTSLAEAKDLHSRAARPNLFIKIPGTKEGLPAIEEAIFAGVPVNVTLLFSREQYLAAAEAYLRGSRAAYRGTLNDQLGIAIGKRAYKAYCDLKNPVRRVGNVSSMPALARNGSCSPAREPKIPRPRTSFTSRRWPRH